MDVWFYSRIETAAERPTHALNAEKNLHRAPPERLRRAFCSPDLSWMSANRQLAAQREPRHHQPAGRGRRVERLASWQERRGVSARSPQFAGAGSQGPPGISARSILFAGRTRRVARCQKARPVHRVSWIARQGGETSRRGVTSHWPAGASGCRQAGPGVPEPPAPPRSTTTQEAITCSLMGTVKDSSGYVIRNATITITSKTTRAVRTLRTNATGQYEANDLPWQLYSRGPGTGIPGHREARR